MRYSSVSLVAAETISRAALRQMPSARLRSVPGNEIARAFFFELRPRRIVAIPFHSKALMTPQALLEQYGPREAMEYDVVVVGAGPGGLATAIRLKQLAAEHGKEVSVVVLEKGSEPGAHILSGAVMDPRALAELFPNWKELGAPLNTAVSEDRFLFLTESGSVKTPGFLLPACFRNHGNYVISLGNLTRWLGRQAEGLGVEIFPGFAAAEILYEGARVKGVATGELGISRSGEKTAAYQPGMELHAKYTFFAEGSRGHLGRQLFATFPLQRDADPQVYGIGLKELW